MFYQIPECIYCSRSDLLCHSTSKGNSTGNEWQTWHLAFDMSLLAIHCLVPFCPGALGILHKPSNSCHLEGKDINHMWKKKKDNMPLSLSNKESQCITNQKELVLWLSSLICIYIALHLPENKSWMDTKIFLFLSMILLKYILLKCL